MSLNAHGGSGQMDGESETFIPQQLYSMMPQNSGRDYKARPVDIAQPVMAAGSGMGDQGGDVIVTHPLRADGFDASEDGTGRGTPFVATAFHQNQRAEVTTNDTSGALNSGGGKPGQGYPAVFFQSSQSGVRDHETHATLDANNGSRRHNGAIVGSAVRRLTPHECERLQGFSDDYTLIPYRGKPAADGPRYKALGNSFAVPVVRWIGERIAAVD